MVLLLDLFAFLCADHYLGSIPLTRVSPTFHEANLHCVVVIDRLPDRPVIAWISLATAKYGHLICCGDT